MTKFGNTALILAVQEGHQHMVRLLLEHGAHPDHSTRLGTARDIALKLGNKETIEMLGFLALISTLNRALIIS